ncbi:MAG: tetratricopeptide repeat protein [Pseudomonadota bacterium]
MMSFFFRLCLLFFAIASMAIAGTVEANNAVTPYYQAIESAASKDRVLHHMRAGVVAFEQQQYAKASSSFDFILDQIELIYTDDENAAKARSLWYGEDQKDFKGEPYERVMAYYYRGLLYLREGDYDNAMASFKGGILQDAFAEEQQFRCDFASIIYLTGWAYQLRGKYKQAKEYYQEAIQLRPDLTMPHPDDNVLIIAELGKSPRKVADGIGHYELKFRKGKRFYEKGVNITVNNIPYPLYPLEDIYFQATTRGGRAVDKVIKNKVAFKKNAASIGNVLSTAGQSAILLASAMDNSSNLGNIGLGIGLLGAVSTIASANANARADTRYWDNLPNSLHISTANIAESKDHQFAIYYYDRHGKQINRLQKKISLVYDDKGNGLLWFRSRSSLVKIPELTHKKSQEKSNDTNQTFDNSWDDSDPFGLFDD